MWLFLILISNSARLSVKNASLAHKYEINDIVGNSKLVNKYLYKVKQGGNDH